MNRMRLTCVAALCAVALGLSGPARAGTCNIDGSTTIQTMDGFGFSSAWSGKISSSLGDTLFGTSTGQLGFTILRIRIDPNKSWSDETSNSAVAHQHGATVFGTPWSPPASMKTNGNVVGGSLSTSSYSAYATYLNQAATSIGLDIVSLQNEPDWNPSYEGCTWTADQFHTFIANNAQAIGKPIMFPESLNFNDSLANTTLNDSSTAAKVSIVGGHFYGGGNSVHTNAISKGKHVWETEHYFDNSDTIGSGMSLAKEVNDAMNNQFSAYLWWWLDPGASQGLASTSGTPYKSAYILAQWSKFVRPGMKRISATSNPSSGIYVTAFQGSSSVVVVAVNTGSSSVTQTFSLQSISGVTSLNVVRTSSSENMASVSAASVSSGSFSYSLSGQSVTTFVAGASGGGGGGGSAYSLTVNKAGTGTGTVTGTSIDCGSTCSASYTSATSVTLTATPASGSTFTGWSGACSGTSTTCTVAVSAAQTVTATFAAGPISSISINVGGAATGTFVDDVDFSGGSTYSTTSTIDTSLLTGTVPPQSVLQTERYGEFTYAVPGFTPGNAYTVTLYFEESYFSSAGQRTFDVAINGSAVLTAFDIYSTAGAINKAVAKSFDSTADSSGQIAIQFSKGGGPDNPKVCGISIAPRVVTCSASPSAPATLTASATSTSQINLAWSAVSPPSSCSVTYSVFRNGTQIAAGLTSASFADTGLSPSTAYSYTVKAVDSAGSSAASNTASATTLTPPDTQAPSAPAGLSASNVTTTSVALSWNASTDNVGVTRYDVYLGSSVAVSSAYPNATITGLSPGTTYTFTVRASDAASNASGASSSLSVTTTPTTDLTPPSAPANLTWASDGSTVSLTWSPSTDNVGVVAYELSYGSFDLGSFTDTVLTLIGFKAGVPYTFTVKARDAAGNLSVASNQTTVLLGGIVDTTPPSAPSNLTLSNATSSSLTIRWSAATDDVGVVVYQVFVNGSLAATVTSTSATVTGLTPSTGYSITVKALDAAGNVSPASAALSTSTSS
jgi:glucuronoarabinoxylan endo-1,4-beta-xylanase